MDTGAGVGLYVHIPFCIKKCSYCDFMSYPYDNEEADLYLTAVAKEIDLYSSGLRSGENVVDSVFIGGGTPTCLPADKLLSLLDKIGKEFYLTPSCEITVEANPGTVNKEYLVMLREWGVNRLSIGVQAFQKKLLGILGRIHGVDDAVEAVLAAQSAGFDNLNVDLLFGIPTQTMDDLQESMDQAVGLGPSHIAMYGLQIEPGTPLEQAVSSNKLRLCGEDLELEMYHAILDFLPFHKYNHYEISNFSRLGMESRHNMTYWLNQPYIGIGPAAHSYFRGERYSNEPNLKKYTQKLAVGEMPVVAREVITSGLEMSETMITGLRLRKGVDLVAFYRRFGRKAEDVFREEITALESAGLVENAQGYLRLTTKGLPVGNIVFKEFVGFDN